jgi:beta-1,4-mannosyltransferase
MNAPLFEPHKSPDAIPGRLILLAFCTIVLPPAVLIGLFIVKMSSKPARKGSATVLVLGDVGRSPRMMYHAESLARKGWETAVVGYSGEYMLCVLGVND